MRQSNLIQTAIDYARRHSHVNWALADQGVVSGSNFVTGILLARALGISEFGRFTLAWIVVLFVQSIQQAAINAPMMTIGPKQTASDHSRYFGALFFQQILFAFFSAALIYACVSASAKFFPDWEIASLVAPLTAVVFFSQIQDFLRRYHFTIDKPAASFQSDVIRYIGQITVLFVMFVVMQKNLTSAMALWIIVGTSALAIISVVLQIGKLAWPGRSLRAITIRQWQFSKWLIASAFTLWLTGNAFIVAAGAMLGVTVVGALKAAQVMMGLANILFLGLENIVPISASRHYMSGGKKALSAYLSRVTIWGTAATCLIALVFALAPEFWFGLLFGEQFVQHAYLVRWYALIYILMFLGLPLRFGLRTLEQTAIIFIAILCAAAFSILSAYPLINQFGAVGVMSGLILVQLIMQIIMWVSFRRHISEGV